MARVVQGLISAVALAFAPLNAAAQQPPAGPTIQQETTLVLRGEGKVELKPDFATINVGVSMERPTAVEAMNEQNKAMTAVIRALKGTGLADRDIQTSNLMLNPVHDYPSNGRPRLRGYTATNTVIAKVRSVDKLGTTIDAIVNAGSNTINGIYFGVENDQAARREARTKAVQDAAAKAEDYAKALGYRVKRIVNVAEPHVQGPEPFMGERVVTTGAMLQQSTPVESGEVSIMQFVDATFELTK